MVKNILHQFHFYKLKVNVCKRETAGYYLVFVASKPASFNGLMVLS